MSEEWRVRLVDHGPAASGVQASGKAVRDLLRSRVGRGIKITKAKAGVFFLYAASPADAAAAQDRARSVLAELGVEPDTRLERLDPQRQVWVVAAGPVAGHTPGQSDQDRKRLLTSAAFIAAFVEETGHHQ